MLLELLEQVHDFANGGYLKHVSSPAEADRSKGSSNRGKVLCTGQHSEIFCLTLGDGTTYLARKRNAKTYTLDLSYLEVEQEYGILSTK